MNIGEAIQRVQSLYSRGLQSQSTRLVPRHTYSALCSGRSTLLQQQYNKGQKISQWAYQTLPCVELVKAKLHECGCVPDKGCTILRTKYKLPQPITGIDAHLIQSVSTITGNIGFDETTRTGSKYSKGNKFTSNKPQFYIHNGYLFLTVEEVLKAITIVAPFGDIVEATLFPNICDCEDCGCQDIMEIEFPIDNDLETALFQLASQELISTFRQMKEDTNDNSLDDTGTGMLHQNQGG